MFAFFHRRELAALEEKYSETERHYHLESQKKEKELEAKRRRLEELQNCLEDTRTRLVSGAAEARNSSMHLDCLRNCRSVSWRGRLVLRTGERLREAMFHLKSMEKLVGGAFSLATKTQRICSGLPGARCFGTGK